MKLTRFRSAYTNPKTDSGVHPEKILFGKQSFCFGYHPLFSRGKQKLFRFKKWLVKLTASPEIKATFTRPGMEDWPAIMILLMVQKFPANQLRLVIYPTHMIAAAYLPAVCGLETWVFWWHSPKQQRSVNVQCWSPMKDMDSSSSLSDHVIWR